MMSMLVSFDGHPRDRKRAGVKPPSTHPKIQECLEHFRLPEKLDEENTWYCNICKDHV